MNEIFTRVACAQTGEDAEIVWHRRERSWVIYEVRKVTWTVRPTGGASSHSDGASLDWTGYQCPWCGFTDVIRHNECGTLTCYGPRPHCARCRIDMRIEGVIQTVAGSHG